MAEQAEHWLQLGVVVGGGYKCVCQGCWGCVGWIKTNCTSVAVSMGVIKGMLVACWGQGAVGGALICARGTKLATGYCRREARGTGLQDEYSPLKPALSRMMW